MNPRINAVVESWPAEDAPAPGSTPLAGVPFLIKDLAVSMRGKRVELGSRLAAGNVARQDSFLMRRFRRAGLVTLGRTATPEFGYSTTTEPVLYGATRNPWHLTRTPGGSSGGSAAAVAAGITPLAHATDAAGSIRVPAASTGLFGLKPTRVRVSLGPDADEVFSGLAVHGGLSRTVRDSAALLDLMARRATGEGRSLGRAQARRMGGHAPARLIPCPGPAPASGGYGLLPVRGHGRRGGTGRGRGRGGARGVRRAPKGWSARVNRHLRFKLAAGPGLVAVCGDRGRARPAGR